VRKAENKQGLVAILDALGAANYSDAQVRRFINAREEVIGLLHEAAEDLEIEGKRGELQGTQLSTFTFGDTLLIAYATEEDVSATILVRFFALIRQFLYASLNNDILFRGAIGIGSFFVNDESNTVMGEAVSDAAAWYEQADWLGAIATPRASLVIEKLMGPGTPKKRWAILDYEVPLKGGQRKKLKCVNWPKVFLIERFRPANSLDDARARFLELITRRSVPFGTEEKYFNSVKFFDYAVSQESKAPVRVSTR
jgi:hypothetical protein